MKKIFVALFGVVIISNAFGDPGEECTSFELESGEAINGNWLDEYGGSYFSCGPHEYPSGNDVGDGCANGAIVWSGVHEAWYQCDTSTGTWSEYTTIVNCTGDMQDTANAHVDYLYNSVWLYYCDYVVGLSAKNICKYPYSDWQAKADKCMETGGGMMYYDDPLCYCPSNRRLQNRDNYTCECIDDDAHLDKIDGSKVCVKGNFWACKTDADCLGGRTPVKPSHSTAWRCVNQKDDVNVCAATDCDSGWHIATYSDGKSKGFCEKDVPDQTPIDPGSSTEPDVEPEEVVVNSENNTVTTSSGSGTSSSTTSKVTIKVSTSTTSVSASIPAVSEHPSHAEVDAAYTRINGLLSKLSVWRDADGNFNKARLASDGVAGVVLGTVGGIVTASVVKRAQVKQGFEDIQCYIGGQPLGGYGDEIMVK